MIRNGNAYSMSIAVPKIAHLFPLVGLFSRRMIGI